MDRVNKRKQKRREIGRGQLVTTPDDLFSGHLSQLRAKRTKVDGCLLGQSQRGASTEHDPLEAPKTLAVLKTVVQESIEDPNVMGSSPEISEAILALSNALKLPGHRVPHSSSKPNLDVYVSQHSNNVEADKARSPELPAVLDPILERSVFTHPACAKAQDEAYDRLEVLGDAYIELIATKLIWNKFPRIPAGRISQIREGLVKNSTLASFAETYGFDRKVLVPAAYSDQAKRWIKTKGDVFEAYVAAVIISDPVEGYQIAENWLRSLWLPMLDNLGHQKTELRAKEELARKVMAKGIKLDYLEERPCVQEKGSGTQRFFIGVYLTGWGWDKKHLGSGQGASKAAAGTMLLKLLYWIPT
ncbi:hypothetical protein N7470_002998 [Penicillium chermesinum]|nr:hypothetical protein N7470_002998 [Penicillium chermesinum]